MKIQQKIPCIVLAVAMFSAASAVAQTSLVSAGGQGELNAANNLQIAAPADPDLVVGNDACVKCHASEVKVWQSTPHATTFDQLHRKPEAKEIATKLGLRSIKHSGRCVACHYTQQSDHGAASSEDAAHVIAGVSCESCHGAAKQWLDLHHNYGGESVTRLTESPAHRAERISQSIRAGMRNPTNVYLVAQSCLRCHTTADEELVNVGGHSAGSLDFEFVSWSQGTIRHNFLQSDGKVNGVRSAEHLRVMFVAGMIAELEASLRATAAATQKAKFGVTSAQRADRAKKRLQSVAAKVSDPILQQILEIAGGVQLKLNHHAELNAAADKIAALGYEFAAQNDGSTLANLDAYLPQTRK
ncbi:MAG: cytochrome c family protein [Planctomycetales bacterium]|nr:cytochrome c family protein [Planctomycetales bacterium]